jgi:hypothetical protein
MKEPVMALQAEIFQGGWPVVAKILAAATGVVLSVSKMSPVPFILGGLASGGIHFFQSYTATAAACVS